jgi:hypothetical protein
MEKWISVREKMPPNTVSVLVWCPERKNKYTACWVAPKWRHFGGISFEELHEDVTHWRPTPEPPPPPLTKKEQIVETIVDTIQKIGRMPTWGDEIRPFAKTLAHEILHDLGESK